MPTNPYFTAIGKFNREEKKRKGEKRKKEGREKEGKEGKKGKKKSLSIVLYLSQWDIQIKSSDLRETPPPRKKKKKKKRKKPWFLKLFAFPELAKTQITALIVTNKKEQTIFHTFSFVTTTTVSTLYAYHSTLVLLSSTLIKVPDMGYPEHQIPFG